MVGSPGLICRDDDLYNFSSLEDPKCESRLQGVLEVFGSRTLLLKTRYSSIMFFYARWVFAIFE